MDCCDHCSTQDFISRASETESDRSRKRKLKRRLNPKGYDPTIEVLPGDPRLQAMWYGVNFHKSQPTPNAWEDWAGIDNPMFDISRNQLEPIPDDADVSKDEWQRAEKRRKARAGSSSSKDLTEAATLTTAQRIEFSRRQEKGAMEASAAMLEQQRQTLQQQHFMQRQQLERQQLAAQQHLEAQQLLQKQQLMMQGLGRGDGGRAVKQEYLASVPYSQQRQPGEQTPAWSEQLNPRPQTGPSSSAIAGQVADSSGPSTGRGPPSLPKKGAAATSRSSNASNYTGWSMAQPVRQNLLPGSRPAFVSPHTTAIAATGLGGITPNALPLFQMPPTAGPTRASVPTTAVPNRAVHSASAPPRYMDAAAGAARRPIAAAFGVASGQQQDPRLAAAAAGMIHAIYGGGAQLAANVAANTRMRHSVDEGVSDVRLNLIREQEEKKRAIANRNRKVAQLVL